MYHAIEDQEKNPQAYVLTRMDPSITEDECHDLLTKPRQTQRTIGFYLKKVQETEKTGENENDDSKNPVLEKERKSFTLTHGNHSLERELKRNKGFWVDRPEKWAHLTYKLKDKYTVDIPKKLKREQGVFCRPDYMELEHHIKLANAGLLYSDEEESDPDDEVLPDTTGCLPLRKIRYKTCDPCKPEEPKKRKQAPKREKTGEGLAGPRKVQRIPTGCQCDFYGDHGKAPAVWDNPFQDEFDMLRQHEMNKYMKPFKREILIKNYERNPPIKYMAREPGMKRTFPVYMISNL